MVARWEETPSHGPSTDDSTPAVGKWSETPSATPSATPGRRNRWDETPRGDRESVREMSGGTTPAWGKYIIHICRHDCLDIRI